MSSGFGSGSSSSSSPSLSRNRNQPVMPANWYSNCSSPTRFCCCSSGRQQLWVRSSHCSFCGNCWQKCQIGFSTGFALVLVAVVVVVVFGCGQAQNGNKKRNQHHELRIKLQIFAARCSPLLLFVVKKVNKRRNQSEP